MPWGLDKCYLIMATNVHYHHRQMYTIITDKCLSSSLTNVYHHPRQMCTIITDKCTPSSPTNVPYRPRQMSTIITDKCSSPRFQIHRTESRSRVISSRGFSKIGPRQMCRRTTILRTCQAAKFEFFSNFAPLTICHHSRPCGISPHRLGYGTNNVWICGSRHTSGFLLSLLVKIFI